MDMLNSYRVGDVLWGDFPCDDGAGHLLHPALVLTRSTADGTVLALVGTSRHVGRGSDGSQVVANPERMTRDQWRLTGLAKATGFDAEYGHLFAVRPGEAAVVGTLVRAPGSCAAIASASRTALQRLTARRHACTH